jgi:hypothetical protein
MEHLTSKTVESSFLELRKASEYIKEERELAKLLLCKLLLPSSHSHKIALESKINNRY